MNRIRLSLAGRGTFLALSVLLLISACSQAISADVSFYKPPIDSRPLSLVADVPVKNVILLIGDGTGISQVAAARIAGAGASGRINIERMPVVGLIKTHSADSLVTDSAAAGTALATGFKTNNGMVSVSPEGKPLRSILEAARDRGMSTGLVATTNITDATPAAFASHVKARGSQGAIAAQLLDSKVNVLLGGGKAFFVPKSEPGSQRKDDRDLLAEAKARGYQVVQSKTEMDAAAGPRLLGLFGMMGDLTTIAPEPSLSEMAGKAIGLLQKNKKGFFLMVEGSLIDHACHGNVADEAIRQTLLFDQAVRVAQDFAVKDKHTLVVVIADHETGGMAISGGNLDGSKVNIKWIDGSHTGSPVGVYVYGPTALLFTGVHDNTETPGLIARILGIPSFPSAKL